MRKKALEAGVSLFVGESGGGEGAHSLGGTSKRQAKEGCGNGVFLSPSPPPSLSLSLEAVRGVPGGRMVLLGTRKIHTTRLWERPSLSIGEPLRVGCGVRYQAL